MLRRILQSLSTLLLSIILATMVWFVAVHEENPPIEDDYGPGIPLEIENTPPGTIIFGDVPDRVTLRLRAPQSSWEELSPAKFRAWIDLADRGPGLHDVPVQVDVSDPSIIVVEKRPGTINVRLEVLAEAEFPIKMDVVDTAPLGYIARPLILDPITATVSGPSSIVNQVNQVSGEVYLRGAKEMVERSVDLSARNVNGEILGRLNINPPKAHVTVPIEQRFGYRDVSVSVVITGEVASGYWIGNITVDPSTVTVVGGPSALNSLPGFVETFEVDVSDATEDVAERVALNLPPGVSVVQPEAQGNGNATGVLVTVDVAAIEGGQTVQRPVTFQGLRETRWAVASPPQVDVILSGPLPRLQALTVRDVTVIADLFGLDPGLHKVAPTVVVPEGLRVESILPDTVEVEIGIGLAPSPTPTATITPTPPITGTATLTGTVPITNTTTLTDTMSITGTATLTGTVPVTDTEAITDMSE
jgi:YbbR domain-containing protein